jgi:hypothetical protein
MLRMTHIFKARAKIIKALGPYNDKANNRIGTAAKGQRLKSFRNRIKPVYSYHHWDSNFVAVVGKWSLFHK